MPVNIGKPPEPGPGWGCTCRAFRMGEPTPEQALAALARSANVTVEELALWQGHRDRMFKVWTEPQNQYTVTYDPLKPGGWCKHTIACLSHFAPWHRQLALGAADALDEIKRLRKENKRYEREIAKLRS